MNLYDDAKRIFVQLLGPNVAKEIDNFDDPKKYPKDFLDECTYFLSKLIGEEAAKKNFSPLYKKYKLLSLKPIVA